jgi:integrase
VRQQFHQARQLRAAAVADGWRRLLRGLWLSGLRLEEAVKLSWDPDAELFIDLSGEFPHFRIYAEAHKSRRDVLLPMTPDFAEFLLQTPDSHRSGAAFPVKGLGGQLTTRTEVIGSVISHIGRCADVVVNRTEGKYASAHDLRRAFGTRWAQRVRPAVLQRLMRHKSIETTLRYYVQLDADDVARELWRMQ